MLWFKRGEAVEKRRGVGVGGLLFESSHAWYGKWKIGGVLSIQVDLQITSRLVLYYINFTMGADLTISVSVETLIQPGRCQLSAPSVHKVKTGVQNMCMKCTCTSPRISVMKERLSHLFICCCMCSGGEFLSSHNCKVCTRGKFT